MLLIDALSSLISDYYENKIPDIQQKKRSARKRGSIEVKEQRFFFGLDILFEIVKVNLFRFFKI